MKIVHVISSIDPSMGGPQAVVMRLAAAQAALGHSVHIVSYGSVSVERQVAEIGAAIPGFDELLWHILPPPSVLETVLATQGYRLLKKVLALADFVHLHGVWEPVLARAARVARARSIPYCVCPAGMLDHWSMQQKSLKKRVALAVGQRAMLNGAQFIHALNQDEVNLMRPLNLSAPCTIIPNGVFADEFEHLPDPVVGDTPYILFLSRLHYKKGLDILADAFRIVADAWPNVDLVVAGPDGGAEDAFRKSIATYGLQNRVRMTGPLYGDAKMQALSSAFCFCLPSRQEGFSIAITEALACGKPVVITDACHFPEVQQANAGVVVPLAADAVASGLLRLLERPQLAHNMGRNGRNLVLSTYTWPKIAAMTLAAYEGQDALKASA